MEWVGPLAAKVMHVIFTIKLKILSHKAWKKPAGKHGMKEPIRRAIVNADCDVPSLSNVRRHALFAIKEKCVP